MTYTIFSFLLLFVHCQASPVPLPQAVAAAIAPPDPPPPGCSGSFPREFGIAVVNISASVSPSQPIRRQAGSTSSPPSVLTVAQVSQIGDGQIQGGMHTVTMAPVTQIADGQIQNPTTTILAAAPGFADSNTLEPAGQTVSDTASAPADSATGIGDEHGCSRPTRSSPVLGNLGVAQAMPSSTTRTGIARVPVTSITSTPTPTTPPISATRVSPPSSTLASASPTLSLVSCLTNSTLRLTLSNNNLYDTLNRTGYIASNYQFQFDGPPQSGALYTSGWSVCPVLGDSADGLVTLALGNTITFWQCLSGEFYNLYTENWAAQCSPVQIRVVGLVKCGG